jgi:hypothetical protein
MIEHLDNMLRDLFLAQVPGIIDPAQVRFEPPDDAWRTWVSNLAVGDIAINVYLADLRENRMLRSNQRMRTIENGLITEEPAPTRLDCHYLITAWSQAAPAAGVEPPLDEHRLLHDTMAVLINRAPINATRIYPAGSAALNAVPSLIRRLDLPTQIAPPEGFPKLSEFWNAMGQNHRWKPAIYLIVTVPITLTSSIAGPMITTRMTEYRRIGVDGTGDVWVQIGGHVFDATVNPTVPVPSARVRLQALDGTLVQTARTNDLGRFTFWNLRRGRYRLIWDVLGQPVAGPRVVDVPSPTGEYDLHFE